LCLLTDDNNEKPIIIRRRFLPSVNPVCGRIMIGVSLSSSVNTICGRIMIGLSLSSVSKHNMWKTTTTQSQSYHILCLLTDDNNDIPIIIRPHIVFTDDDNDNPIIIRPPIVFTDGRQQRSNHNSLIRPHIVYYDWVVVVVRQ
jgi:hypothetical protein